MFVCVWHLARSSPQSTTLSLCRSRYILPRPEAIAREGAERDTPVRGAANEARAKGRVRGTTHFGRALCTTGIATLNAAMICYTPEGPRSIDDRDVALPCRSRLPRRRGSFRRGAWRQRQNSALNCRRCLEFPQANLPKVGRALSTAFLAGSFLASRNAAGKPR